MSNEVACAFPQNQCGPFGTQAHGAKGDQNPAFCHRITINNCGTEPLAGFTVVDTLQGDVSAQFFPSNGQLDVGASVTHTYRSAVATDMTNVVNVNARGATSSTLVSANAQAVALVEGAALVCTVSAAAAGDLDGDSRNGYVLPAGNATHTVTIEVTVSNVCNVPLVGVTLSAPSLAALGCQALPAPFDLPVGASVHVSLCTVPITCPGSNAVHVISAIGTVDPASGCAHDIAGEDVTVRGDDAVIAECTDEDRFAICNDTLCVTKQVACVAPEGACGTFADSATGIRASACPAFRYRITVSNCGDSELTHLALHDDQLNLAGCSFPASLAPGQTVTCEVPAEHCGSQTSTVKVMALLAATGQLVTNSAAAAVIVKSASLASHIILGSPLDNDVANCGANPCDNHLLLPGGFADPIDFLVTVRNTGETPLENIAFVGLPGGCAPTNVPARLAPDGSFTVACAPVVSCPGGTFTVNVTANASDMNGGGGCSYDRNGHQIGVTRASLRLGQPRRVEPPARPRRIQPCRRSSR